MELELVEFEVQDCHHGHGLLIFMDSDGNEFHFSLTAAGDTEDAVREYFRYVQSERFSHIRWMVSQIRNEAGEAPNQDFSDQVDNTPLSFPGIIEAEIHYMLPSDLETVSNIEEVSTRTELLLAGEQRFALYISVISGKIQATVAKRSILISSRQRNIPLGEHESNTLLLVENRNTSVSKFVCLMRPVTT